jgi:hypothetical protein
MAGVKIVGKVGMAYEFDGGGAYIETDVVPQLMPGESMSIAFWVAPPDHLPNPGEVYNVLGFEKTLAQEIRFYILGDGRARATWRDDSHSQFNNTTTFSLCDGRWHHVVMVCDRTNMTTTLYIDGQIADDDEAPAGPINLTESRAVFMATNNHSGGLYGFLKGAIDEVWIYDHALTQAEVLDHLPPEMRCPPDINQDGIVDLKDLGILLAAFGNPCP